MIYRRADAGAVRAHPSRPQSPAAAGRNPRQRIEELHARATPYRETAHIILAGGRGNPGNMVRQIEEALARC